MRFLTHPVWLVGFRPFFILACLSGLSLPIIWALLYNGIMHEPLLPFSITQWHAHEMFFGFGWAVIGGFLLTSTKNWVNARGYHGAALMYLVTTWVFERFGMWFAGSWPPLLFRISNNLFLVSIVVMLLWTLISHRKDDTYRDNYFFLVILPAFLLAKNLMLSSEYIAIGWSMAMGLFRMAFLVMLERTLTPFMKGAFHVSILRNAKLDKIIKLLGLAMVFESLLPPLWSGFLAFLLAGLLLGRLMFWKPLLALRRIDIGIMYLGYLAIFAQLLIHFFNQVVHTQWVGAVSIHVFTFGTMGLIIPAMLIRISQGHTGRKVVFDNLDKAALYIMLLGFLVRIVLPQFYADKYELWTMLAAGCWLVCFSLLGWRYIPYLLAPRIDGREH